MYKIRQIKYTTNSVSIQVYKLKNRKRVIIRHIVTARDEQEKSDLLSFANDFIEKAWKQLHLFENNHSYNILYVHQTEFAGVHYAFLYEPIKLHLLICFMALVISKHVELQTQMSIKRFIHECKKMTDARMKNKLTGKGIRIRANPTPRVQEILSKLNLLT